MTPLTLDQIMSGSKIKMQNYFIKKPLSKFKCCVKKIL